MYRDSFELMSPDGSRIVGTLEHLQGTALADRYYEKDGKILPIYVGDTEVHWNGQEGVDFEGEPVLIDEDGRTWLARECRRGPVNCECDNTHEANDTVCRWCWARGRRKWDDPDVTPGPRS